VIGSSGLEALWSRPHGPMAIKSGRRVRAAPLVLAALAVTQAAAATAQGGETPNMDIRTVHIVSADHLDAGFKYPYVAQVLSEWMNRWIPDSIELSEQLRAAGGEVQHRWTMSPWVASFLLDCPHAVWRERNEFSTTIESPGLVCPNASAVAAFKAAVARGDINFYASAFCTMFEYGDAELTRWTSDFVRSIGTHAGQKHRSTVASQRDEPGITRAAIPQLVARGVTGLSVGMDASVIPPDVPPAFVWRDEPSGTELLVAWHSYGYGGGRSGRSWGSSDSGFSPEASGPGRCMTAAPGCNSTITVPGFSHALALFVSEDNRGPPTREQLEHYFNASRQLFPNATLISSTYEAFFEELQAVRHILPVITSEIGDTWVDTAPSDPLLAAQFRALMRARSRCATEAPTACNDSDTTAASPFYNFSRFLLKNIEHDWGSNGGFAQTGPSGGIEDCAGVATFGGFNGTGSWWRWVIRNSLDGVGPTIHWLQFGNSSGWHSDMLGWQATGLANHNGPAANLLNCSNATATPRFWNAQFPGSSAPWLVTVKPSSKLHASRFRYSVYVAADAPADFELQTSEDGKHWQTVLNATDVTSVNCSAPAAGPGGIWSNMQLNDAMSACDGTVGANQGCRNVISWLDQRAWGVEMALAALPESHPLLAIAQRELQALVPVQPHPLTEGLVLVEEGHWAVPLSVAGGIGMVSFDSASGALTELRTLARNRSYAGANNLLAELVVHTSSPAQRQAWAAAYMEVPRDGMEFYKLGDTLGDGVGRRPMVRQMWRSSDNNTVLLRQELDAHVVSDYGGAAELWQRYTFRPDAALVGGLRVSITASAFNKTATRITESWWMRFQPRESTALNHSAMMLEKLGRPVAPLDVVVNGSRTLHGLTLGGVSYLPAGFRVSSLDVPVVKVGSGNASLNSADGAPLLGLNPSPVPNDRSPSLADGFAFNIYNNEWGTNG
jgi:hypothetical protein